MDHVTICQALKPMSNFCASKCTLHLWIVFMMITILSVEMLEVNSPGSFTIGSVHDYHTKCICASGPI